MAAAAVGDLDKSKLEEELRDIERRGKDAEGLDGGGEQSKEVVVAKEEVEKLVKEMRQAVEQGKVSTEGISDATLKRFLRARDMNVSKATKMFINHVQWRAAAIPSSYITLSEISNESACKKVFLQLKEGHRSVVILHGRKHETWKRDLEEFKRYAIYATDKAIASLPQGEEKYGVLLDLQSAGYKNMDPRAMIVVFEMLQAHYPERLGRLFMVHVPYVFWGVWKVVSPFIDRVTREKIIFVEDKNLSKTLLAEIPEDMLPPEYGGTGKLVSLEDAEVPNWPPQNAQFT